MSCDSRHNRLRFSYCVKAPISTSHIGRSDLAMRLRMGRYMRLTNGHNKSLRHHTAMQALFVAWYNFARKHETLTGMTPAMVSNLTDHLWTIKELIERAAAQATIAQSMFTCSTKALMFGGQSMPIAFGRASTN
jgi:hypothetical protein